MKALVTGADGLLGSNLVRRFLEKGFDVRALIFPGSLSKTLDELPVRKIEGNILDGEAVKKAAKDCEAVFHVAASTAMWPPRDPRITDINVNGTKNVLDAVEAAGTRRLVHVGSASSFGYGTKENPGNEETPFAYTGQGVAYFDSKLAAQKIVLEHVKSGRVDAVVVNPTFMFGAYDSGPSSGRMIKRYVEMRLPVYTPGGRNFVHVRDVADGMISAFEKGKSGECYILGNSNLSMKEILTMVAETAEIAPPRIVARETIIKLAGLAGSLSGLVTGKAPDMTIEIARNACEGCYYSAAKAVRDLGLPQTPVDEAVRDSFEWMKENGYIKK